MSARTNITNVRNRRVQVEVDAWLQPIPMGLFGCKKTKDGGSTPRLPAVFELADCLRGISPNKAVTITPNFFAKDKAQRLFVYMHGTYVPVGTEFVQYATEGLFKKQQVEYRWTPAIAAAVEAYILHDYHTPKLWEVPSPHVLNLRNGLLDISGVPKQGKHTPEFLQAGQFDFDYDPEAKCEKWDKQFAYTFPADALMPEFELPYQVLAACILTVAINKAILLFGQGGSGKSRFLQAIINFLGSDNVSAQPFNKLEESRWAAADLYGKLANICADLPGKKVEASSYFKKIVTGDECDGEVKYGDPFKFKPYATVIFSANQYPESADASDAFFSRWIVVPFERVWRDTEGERDSKEIDAELTDPREQSGALNRALKWIRSVESKGIKPPASCVEALSDFRAATDPVGKWLEQNIMVGPSYYIGKDQLYQSIWPPMQTSSHGRISAKRSSANGFRRSLATESYRVIHVEWSI
jgi:putative DNA primase/helicase